MRIVFAILTNLARLRDKFVNHRVSLVQVQQGEPKRKTRGKLHKSVKNEQLKKEPLMVELKYYHRRFLL